MRFKVERTQSGTTWHLYDDGGVPLASAGRSFPSFEDAQRAAEVFRVTARTAGYEVNRTGPSSWCWRAWHASQTIAVSDRPFTNADNARVVAHDVRDHVQCAPSPQSS